MRFRAQRTEDVPVTTKISFVCLRQRGDEAPSTVRSFQGCEESERAADHFHDLRHPYVKHTTKKI